MNQRTERSIKRGVANTFGSFGYISCFLQWFWAIILYFSVIQSIALFISSHSEKPVEVSPSATLTLPEPLGIAIVVVTVIFMIILTVYALISIPKNIVKTGNKMVRRTAETVTPVVIKTQHTHNTKKNRIIITAKLAFAIKVLLIIIPIALTISSGLLEKPSIDYPIAMIIGCTLACLSVIFFAIQYLLAKLLRVKVADLW